MERKLIVPRPSPHLVRSIVDAGRSLCWRLTPRSAKETSGLVYSHGGDYSMRHPTSTLCLDSRQVTSSVHWELPCKGDVLKVPHNSNRLLNDKRRPTDRQPCEPDVGGHMCQALIQITLSKKFHSASEEEHPMAERFRFRRVFPRG